ncbi:MAG: hypothetical protein AB4041_10055, partial [Microcystaceae cyanobacterium]
MENSLKIASTTTVAALLATATFSPVLADVVLVDQGISEAEVVAAQDGWCKALIDISTTNAERGREAAAALAEKVIDSAYGYQMG